MTDQKEAVEVSYPPEEDMNEIKIDSETSTSKTTARKKSIQKKHQAKTKDQETLIGKIAKERDEYKDKYLRNLAEIDNFRKRVRKEKEDFQKFALTEFLIDMLPVVDNLERALKAKESAGLAANDEYSILSGVEMIYKQLIELLKKYNVAEIQSLNKVFDPNIHQALSKEEKEGIDKPTIIEVYQKGFMYNNKLLRPALTKVAIPVEETAETEAAGDRDTYPPEKQEQSGE